MKLRQCLVSVAVAAAALVGGSAQAALTVFQTYVGNYGVSTDGWGSTSQSGVISASVPAGATVTAAYLYTSTHSFGLGPAVGYGGTLAGSAVNYSTNLGTIPNPACCNLTAHRADVTSIVKPLVDGGAGGTYNFNITETSANQDGSALVVVYELASLGTSTVGILDGYSLVTGDATAINFGSPLDPSAAGFFAEMRLGIGFSCCGQASTVDVNGVRITNSAGNSNDGEQPSSNGSLITVGGFDDAFSSFLPGYNNDTERYNLVPYISAGDTSINIRTTNASADDNVFLAVFHVSGEARINEPPPPPPNGVPEPMTLSLMGLALLGMGAQRKYLAKRA